MMQCSRAGPRGPHRRNRSGASESVGRLPGSYSPPVRVKEQLHRDLGRTSYALVILMKIANMDTQTVISALIKQAKTLPNELYKSLTWDRGKELTDHRRFTYG